MGNYLASNTIQMYPSSYRIHTYDPESYLNTEQNIINTKKLSGNNTLNSYVTEDGNDLIIYLGGYYFKFGKSALTNLGLGNNVWAYIKLINDPTYYTGSNTFNNLRIDNIESTGNKLDSGNAEFQGLKFVDSDPSSGYDYKIQVLAGGVIPASSKLKLDASEVQGATGKPITDEFNTTTLKISGNAFTTQTAYTSKGSATKVPQITTNTMGQVTDITEVTITQPVVNDGTLTITQNGVSKGTFSANQSGNSTIALTDTITTDTNQKIKVGNTTFGDNDVVDIVAGNNVTITPATTGTGAPKITIGANTSTLYRHTIKVIADNVTIHGNEYGGLTKQYSAVESFRGSNGVDTFIVSLVPLISVKKVLVDGVVSTVASFDSTTGAVKLTSAPTAGADVKIIYTYEYTTEGMINVSIATDVTLNLYFEYINSSSTPFNTLPSYDWGVDPDKAGAWTFKSGDYGYGAVIFTSGQVFTSTSNQDNLILNGVYTTSSVGSSENAVAYVWEVNANISIVDTVTAI